MIRRGFIVFVSLWALSQATAVAQNAFVPSFGGKVFADGRTIDWTLEVRLEGQDSSLVASAHTRGSSDFSFRNVMLQRGAYYFLIINEPGYRELRYALNPEDFKQDNRNPGVYFYTGLITLNIESIPPEERSDQKRLTGPKAIDVEQLKTRIPDKARKEYELALADIDAGKSDTALTHLEKAVEFEPKYYDALNRLGAEYLRAKQYRKAEQILERAHDLNPNDSVPVTNLGALYFERGERLAAAGDTGAGAESVEASYRKAVDLFEEALRLDPLAPRTNYYLGTALYRVGAYERAESLLINALALDAEMQQARLTLLNLYIRQNRYDDVVKQIDAYLAAYPDAPQRQQMEKLRLQIESSK
jgi:tetratricopeptide (TPR) repeat protein